MAGMAADRSRSKRGSKVVAQAKNHLKSQAWVDDRLLMDTVHTELRIEISSTIGSFFLARHWVPLINSKSLGHLRPLCAPDVRVL